MVKVGQIINNRGLKGECKVYPYTDEPYERFQKGRKVVTDKGEELVIRAMSPYKNLFYLFFDGIDTVEKAEALKGQNIWINEKDLPELDDDEFYYHELFHCKVFNENKEYLGTVTDILENGAHLNLRIGENEKEFLLPFVNAFILDVDTEKKEIIINDMEGLR